MAFERSRTLLESLIHEAQRVQHSSATLHFLCAGVPALAREAVTAEAATVLALDRWVRELRQLGDAQLAGIEAAGKLPALAFAVGGIQEAVLLSQAEQQARLAVATHDTKRAFIAQRGQPVREEVEIPPGEALSQTAVSRALLSAAAARLPEPRVSETRIVRDGTGRIVGTEATNRN